MPKKTTILIVILAIITAVLIFLAIHSDQTQQTVSENTHVQTTPTPVLVKPFAALSFSPSLIDVSKGIITQKVDILLDSMGKPVSGAQIELTYDPKVLTNVALTPPVKNSFFGTNPIVLINSVDPAQGRISYAVGISASDKEKNGSGSVATLTFTVNKFAGVATSQISFLPKSAVTTLSSQASVLNSSTPLQIIVSQPATSTPSAVVPSY